MDDSTMPGHGIDGPQARTSVAWAMPSPTTALGPRRMAAGSRIAARDSANAVVRIGVSRAKQHDERVRHRPGPLGPGDAEVADGRARERQGATAQPRQRGGREDADERVEPTPPGPSRGLDREREQPDQPQRRQDRAGEEGKAGARVAPDDREPGDGERGVHDCGRLGDVAERQDRRRQRDQQPEPWCRQGREPGRDGDREHEPGGPEREHRGPEQGHDGSQASGDDACLDRQGRSGDGRLGRRAVALRPRPARTRCAVGSRAPSGSGERLAELVRELRGGRTACGVESESRVDDVQETAREVGAAGRERRSAAADRTGDLRERNAPERVLAGQSLPQHHADGPDVASLGRLLAGEPLGGDVGKGSRHVADRRERVGLVELREPEVEELHGDRRALFDHDVRRLHVTVDDPLAMRVGQGVEHLGRTPRPPRGRRATRHGAARAACARARPRRRCRRGPCPRRSRAPGRSDRVGGATRPPSPALRALPACPLSGRSSARRRGRCARRGRATPIPTHRARGVSGVGNDRERARGREAREPQRTPVMPRSARQGKVLHRRNLPYTRLARPGLLLHGRL